MIIRVQIPGQTELPQLTDTLNPTRFLFGRDQRRQEQSGQNRNDGHNDQQLDQRESDESAPHKKAAPNAIVTLLGNIAFDIHKFSHNRAALEPASTGRLATTLLHNPPVIARR